MTEPSVGLEVHDEEGTPFFTIRSRCGVCGVIVTERRIDARVDAENGIAFGDADANALLAHVRTHGD